MASKKEVGLDYEYEATPAIERARIFRDRLRGVENTIAVYQAALAVRDGGAEDRLAEEIQRANGLKTLIDQAQTQADNERVDPNAPMPGPTP